MMRRRLRLRLGLCLCGISLGTALHAGEAERAGEPADGPQVPIALAWGPGQRLHVALREARRVAVVDPAGWKVVEGRPLGFRPRDLVFAANPPAMLIGGMDGELLAMDLDGSVVCEMKVGRGPARVRPLNDGRAAVACLWDERVTIVDFARGTVVARHPLPFAPGAMVRRPDGRLVVADAFAGGLADLEPGLPGTERVRLLDGVNLRALAISGDGRELLIAHTDQYDTVPITEANIDWGLVVSSRLTAVRLTDFDARPAAGEHLPRRRLALDGSRHGAADPAAMAVTPDGNRVLIALAGAHQVLLDDRRSGAPAIDLNDLLPLGHNQRLEVVEVGRSPTAIALDPSGSYAVTADSMSDTLSVVSTSGLSRIATVTLADHPPVRTAAQRGEAGFLDGRRALDRWLSCATCHGEGHTNGRNFDTLGDGGYGAPKNTPSLLGVGRTSPYGWIGAFATLDDQVHQSLVSSLRGRRPQPDEVADLTAYLASLAPPPPRRNPDDPAAIRGAAVFRAQRCDSCHRGPDLTVDGLRDVGLDDGSGGHRRFNPPSLRGVARSAPYLHDGRAATLDDVLSHHHPGRDEPLDPRDRDDLVAFLESL